MEPNTFNHEVWIAYSDDGSTWSFPEEDIPFEGSVPDILRRDNTLYAFGGRGTIKRYHLTLMNGKTRGILDQWGMFAGTTNHPFWEKMD